MAETVVLVKFPGQPLCFMQVPTEKINEVSRSISGLHGAEVNIASLYKGFYYILMNKDQNARRLPTNMTAYLIDRSGSMQETHIVGPFVICKLPQGLTGSMRDMTQEDAAQVQKLLQQ